jgi:hypothetical protein
MKRIIVKPVGLKGNEINDRIKELMKLQPINEEHHSSSVELTKIGPDGLVYGIVRENHTYFIKTTDKHNSLIAEDFKYIGGLQNKMQEAYPTYAKALRHLNIKFNSISESLGEYKDINVFENDIIGEDVASFQQYQGNGFSNEGNLEGNDPLVTEVEDEELSEEQQAVEDLITGEEKEDDVPEAIKEHKLSIGRSLDDLDSIIESIVKPKKKVYTLK